MNDYIEDFVEDESAASSDLFDCDYTPIDAVVNQVTVFTGCTTRATENGDRMVVAYGEGAAKSAFFTDSKKLKNVFGNPNRKISFPRCNQSGKLWQYVWLQCVFTEH